ncbi:F-box domain [Cinara cedri]|uniref:F-box domain n=1 Tax=Cinara cedri TaxID=506608 RepID=A0A5E4N2N7_9HEMI|nr:F-box domain [Cinara cedri]
MDTPPSTSRYFLRRTTRSVTNAVDTASTITSPLYEGNFGVYLTEQYDVLKMVLSYLNYHDLNVLRQVNRSMRKAANILLKKRSWIQCSSLSYVYKSDYWAPPAYHGHYVDLKIEPKVLFSFEALASGYSVRSRPTICLRLREKNGTFDPRADLLPSSVEVFVPVGAKGIIYPEANDSEMIINIMHSSLHKKLALVYLPKSNGYDITVFSHVIAAESFPIHEYISSDPRPIRGLIFLKVGTMNIDAMMRFIVKMVEDNQSEPFALAGGHVSSLECDNPPKKNQPGIFKVIIIRGNGIRCLSDIISQTTIEAVNEELKVTSTYVKNNFGKYDVHKTIILMFQCVDRYLLSTEDHVQLAKAFPDIPIVGVQTWGEIGLRSFNPTDSKFTPKKKRMPLVHSIKTTFMLMAID